MRWTFLLTASLLLAACTTTVDQAQTGQTDIQHALPVATGAGHAVETVKQTEKNLCSVCGSGCIPQELAPFTSCMTTTESFTCAFQGNACKRTDS